MISRRSGFAVAEPGCVFWLVGIALTLSTQDVPVVVELPESGNECVGSINHVTYFLALRVRF